MWVHLKTYKKVEALKPIILIIELNWNINRLNSNKKHVKITKKLNKNVQN